MKCTTGRDCPPTHLSIWLFWVSFKYKTPGYHRDVFRPPTLLKMRFQEKLTSYISSISHRLVLPNLKKIKFFVQKHPNVWWQRDIFKKYYHFIRTLHQFAAFSLYFWKMSFFPNESKFFDWKPLFSYVFKKLLFFSHSTSNLLQFGNLKFSTFSNSWACYLMQLASKLKKRTRWLHDFPSIFEYGRKIIIDTFRRFYSRFAKKSLENLEFLFLLNKARTRKFYGPFWRSDHRYDFGFQTLVIFSRLHSKNWMSFAWSFKINFPPYLKLYRLIMAVRKTKIPHESEVQI